MTAGSPGACRCVEGAAAAAIIAARKGRHRELVRYGVTDEQAVEAGLACGGTIEAVVEPEIPPEALAAAIGNQAVAIASHLPVGRETSTISRVVIDRAGRRSGSLWDAASDAELAVLAQTALDDGSPRAVRVGQAELFIDVVMPVSRLIIVGAGEIADHLVRLAHAFGFWTTVIDARSAWATRERFPDADALLLGWVDELAGRAGIDAEAYVVTLAQRSEVRRPATARGPHAGESLRRCAWQPTDTRRAHRPPASRWAQ